MHSDERAALQPVDNSRERKPFRWFHGGVNAAGYGVGFVAGENTGASEAGGSALQPVNKRTSCNFCSGISSLSALFGKARCYRWLLDSSWCLICFCHACLPPNFLSSVMLICGLLHNDSMTSAPCLLYNNQQERLDHSAMSTSPSRVLACSGARQVEEHS